MDSGPFNLFVYKLIDIEYISIYSYYYIYQYYKSSDYRPLQNGIPSTTVLVSLFCAFLMTVVSEVSYIEISLEH